MDNPPVEVIREFVKAASENQQLAEEMLSANPSLINARCMHDATVVHYLTTNSSLEGVLFLAERGADVNLRNKFGDAPLLDAAMLGNYDIASVLLDYGADPNVQSSGFETPILCAVRSGSAKLVALLLERGADPKYRTPNGKTLFDVLPLQSKLRLNIYRILEKYAAQPGSI